MPDVDVVIVGGGPVGLLLSAELGLAGVSSLVLEQLPESAARLSPALRAVTTQTIRTLALRGLHEPIVAAAQEALAGLVQAAGGLAHTQGPRARRAAEATSTKLGRGGSLKGHFSMVQLMDPEQDFPDLAVCPAPYAALQRIFADRAREFGARVVHGHPVTDVTVEPGCVSARLGDGRRVTGRFLVGADGGRSAVRAQAGFDFQGTEPSVFAIGGEDVTLADPQKLPHGFTRMPNGVLLVNVVPRQVVSIEFAPPQDRGRPPTAAELQASLRRVSGTDVTVTEVGSPFRYSDHARQSSSYRRGPVLLAGDAAHVHSPFGGQGVNLGLQDAVNLGWKLAAVVHGRLPETVLDTYTHERHPVAARVLRNSRAQSALLRPGPEVDAMREVLAEMSAHRSTKQHLLHMLHGIDLDYEPAGPTHPLVGRFSPSLVLAGGSPDDALLPDGAGLLVDLHGSRTLRDWAVRWPSVRVARGECLGHPQLAGLLIRPDGYVAWAGDGDPGGSRLAGASAFERWFGAPLEPPVSQGTQIGA